MKFLCHGATSPVETLVTGEQAQRETRGIMAVSGPGEQPQVREGRGAHDVCNSCGGAPAAPRPTEAVTVSWGACSSSACCTVACWWCTSRLRKGPGTAARLWRGSAGSRAEACPPAMWRRMSVLNLCFSHQTHTLL